MAGNGVGTGLCTAQVVTTQGLQCGWWVGAVSRLGCWLQLGHRSQVPHTTTTPLLPAGGEGLLPVVVATFTPTQLATCCTMVKWVWSDIVIINHLKTPATGQAPGMV